MKQALIAAIAAIAVGGCKKKPAASDDAAAAAPDDGAERPAAAGDPPAAPADPDPYYEPIPDKPAEPEPPAPAVPVAEAGTPMFFAGSGARTPVGWTVDATDLRFEAVLIGDREDSADVQITMASGGRQARIATCRGLAKDGDGAVTAYKSGDDVVFISCFTKKDSADQTGRSWGVRVKWNKDKRVAEVAGNWESDGQADFETMDFDERP